MLGFYSIALFFHILGALALFAAVGVIAVGMLLMRQARTVEQLRERAGMATSADRLLPISVVLILLPALYMLIVAWGWSVAWLDTALVSFVVILILGPVFIGRRIEVIRRAAETTSDGAIPAPLHAQRNDPVLWAAMSIFTTLAIGIAFLMAVKPDLLGSLITVAVALLLGVLVALLFNRETATEKPQQVDLRGSVAEKN